MPKFINPRQAADLINDGDVIVFAADGLSSYPNEIVEAIEERFLNEGHPAGITSMRAAGMGDFKEEGEHHWCHEGLMTRSISSYISVVPKLGQLVAENKIQAYMFPMGPILQLFRAVGRGMPGVITKTGLGTFMDPRLDGGKCNQLTIDEGEDLVQYIPDLAGDDYLMLKSPGMDVALLRGTYADSKGNISTEKEATDMELLSVAQAVKASGGIVICQVEDVVDLYDIKPRMVKVPGIYVDYVVIAKHPHKIPQNGKRRTADDFQPSFIGEEIIDFQNNLDKLPLDHKKVIARRAAMEIKKGYNVNFGIGMPQNIPSVMAEHNGQDAVTMISETGVIGGIPGTERDFGCHWNVEAFCDHGMHFSFFNGGLLDVGVFGIGEIDAAGNMNTSHLNGKISGIGGFTDITEGAKKILFIGTFTAVGLKTEVGNREIKIVQEGKFKKFIKKCDKVTFSAAERIKKHGDFLMITERCVLRGTKEGMVLQEIAPGIDIQKDILDQCEFDLIIPKGGPHLMDPSIFTEDDFELDYSEM